MTVDTGENTAGSPTALPKAPDAIELRHLRAFVTVAEELNFGRAATRLYVSQPALSRQISGLERLVGCDLLRRTTHRVELTLAGEALLDRARRILGDVDEAVSATRAVGGELLARIAKYWKPLDDPDPELQVLRDAYEDLHARFPPPPEVRIRPINAGGVSSLLLTPEQPIDATVLFLHGGGYISGSAFGYRALVGALATAAHTTALLPDYRLAPEHPFPAAVEDALSAYRWLLDTGTDPGRIILVGDSVGAHLTMSTLIRLKEQELPLPAAVVSLCPGIDLHCSSHTGHEQKAHGERIVEPGKVTAEQIQRRIIGDYLAGHPDDDPVVAPLRADLSGLPPLLVQVGTGDTHLTDAHQLVDHARAHGVDVRLELYPVATHNFHLFRSFLPEAADALEHAGRFIREQVTDGGARAGVRTTA
ncbi:alpha/beta hydrolase fold domain-containing protein [Nocardia acidivorans]|uniref:alpha/beta hydrolase fold domain-containing protein n=1 Tax=Nocardia acidivorans TaxID=404580 RepID=UPI0008325270|nr:alpha/beta hydrolase fold domain-containing protein [Nocardia acidivorans]